ncbi:hypothetical protein DC3_38900 [Deinococcus cellulosilyticus NBRC 106333 = KACC 11606]|uniref:Uncharacterized protein n=1 Tax=Deinococcus cellulosilyticus (strain DSM 18568 / NBRC 106333 / KACC 11606 / 5516J-15) TaxID=1223518 RepID=A0A511N5X4_DEIC1|nr:hypothetical protein DC3_38900 [Deinococcus cellulosilyticus NBRC 106333 = KACC 11606]
MMPSPRVWFPGKPGTLHLPPGQGGFLLAYLIVSVSKWVQKVYFLDEFKHLNIMVNIKNVYQL